MNILKGIEQMKRKNKNLVVLIDSAGQDRRMKQILKQNGLKVLRQCESGTYPNYYMLKESENDYFSQVLPSVTWIDSESKTKHSIFSDNAPYTDVISLNDFIVRGEWAVCDAE